MDESVAVQQLDCAGRIYGILRLASNGRCRRKAYLRAHPLAAGHYRMAHRVKKNRGPRPGQQFVKFPVYAINHKAKVTGEIGFISGYFTIFQKTGAPAAH